LFSQSDRDPHGQRPQAQADQVDDEQQDRAAVARMCGGTTDLAGAVDRPVPEGPRKALMARMRGPIAAESMVTAMM
jgi:hypothetical protein